MDHDFAHQHSQPIGERTVSRAQRRPYHFVEADDEIVVRSLVVSGLGIALMREDLAFEKASAGEMCLWQDVRLTTCLPFVYLRERDPVIRALVDILKDLWNLRAVPKKPRS